MTDELTLFNLDAQTTVCLWPDHAATTGYSRGCRCERCLEARRGQTVRAKSGMCNIEGCDNRRMKGRGYCTDHVPLAKDTRPVRRTIVNGICKVCGAEHHWYESTLEWNVREETRDLHRWTCRYCRTGYVGAIQRHNLDATTAIRLITATHCEHCGDRFASGHRGRKRSVVDHDHACCPGTESCGRCIRGIICIKCNTRLGVIDTMIQANELDAMLNYIASRSSTRRP